MDREESRMRWRSLLIGAVAAGAALGGLSFFWQAEASDHDDGENDNKARALNITDVYAFREDWQTGNAGDSGNLIVIMNTNPRSMARQQYYFSTNARSISMPASVSAIRRAASELYAPIRLNGGPAGFVSGPSRLNTVRTPSARRTGATSFMAGW